MEVLVSAVIITGYGFKGSSTPLQLARDYFMEAPMHPLGPYIRLLVDLVQDAWGVVCVFKALV